MVWELHACDKGLFQGRKKGRTKCPRVVGCERRLVPCLSPRASLFLPRWGCWSGASSSPATFRLARGTERHARGASVPLRLQSCAVRVARPASRRSACSLLPRELPFFLLRMHFSWAWGLGEGQGGKGGTLWKQGHVILVPSAVIRRAGLSRCWRRRFRLSGKQPSAVVHQSLGGASILEMLNNKWERTGLLKCTHRTGNAFETLSFTSFTPTSFLHCPCSCDSISSPHPVWGREGGADIDMFLASVLCLKFRTIAGEDLFVFMLVEEVFSLS